MAAADLVVTAIGAHFICFSKIGFRPTVVPHNRDEAHRARRARRFFLAGGTIDADAALSAGLVDYVVADDCGSPEAEKIARELASGPTKLMAESKNLFLQTPNRSRRPIGR